MIDWEANGRGDDSVCGWGREPFVAPYVNLFSIAHMPLGTLSNNPKAIENAPPRVGWGGAKRCTKDVTGGKISCLEDMSNKGAWISKDSPSYLRGRFLVFKFFFFFLRIRYSNSNTLILYFVYRKITFVLLKH